MTPLLETIALTRHYGERTALSDVSLTIAAGEILGVVGESGSGKSTLARLVMALDRPTSGTVRFQGKDILAGRALRKMRREFQMVFQDHYGSLDPRQTIGKIVAEPLHLEPGCLDKRERVAAMLEDVGLSADHAQRYPHEFSGGQRQRIAIARALITRPKLLVADEPTSALDVTVQAQILDLILKMRAEYGISVLLITHNIAVVDEICDRAIVMQQGRIVEEGRIPQLLDTPAQDYTRRLLSAEPRFLKQRQKSPVSLSGDRASRP
ncbi:ABC transporter ATP-binding protein [Martelella limonii]|uniref:ABC transporter ATP-binding protein n=1 Tax=Martelella limonii TaxID=1647649 RepID=UPI0015802D6D|nr:dipeptide/oligopeptide/nickel ABC transporter ATP-binding protein [Martelella limonii]